MLIRARLMWTLVPLLLATPAWSEPLKVPQIDAAAPITRVYQCSAGRSLTVSYWNATNGQSFALLPVDGKPLLFVNTLAASGVRYQAGQYVWWTKGNRADLYDQMAGENAAPILPECTSGR